MALDRAMHIEDYLIKEAIPTAKYDSHLRTVLNELLNFVKFKKWEKMPVGDFLNKMQKLHGTVKNGVVTDFFHDNKRVFSVKSQWPNGEEIKRDYDFKEIPSQLTYNGQA